MAAYSLLVFIGRFQPFHEGHAHILKRALELGDKVVIIIGSAAAPRSPRNPFTAEERIEMIQSYCADHFAQDLHRIVFEGVEDRYYNEARWLSDVKKAVAKHQSPGQTGLIGHAKDRSSYYLTSFPEYTWVSVENYHNVHATQMRESWYTHQLFQQQALLHFLPASIERWLKAFMQRPEFAYLCDYYAANQAYRKEWAVAPYPVVLVTVDALVTCCKHVLLIKRGNHPGLGYFAMREGIIRELIEETQIQLPKEVLNAHLESITLFDHPDRSEVTRKITHAGYIVLPHTTLPQIAGADDALEARWVSFQDLPGLKEQIHGDHYPIMNQMLGLD
jgi:bifunctional NMN adenylyltransferase/nudix hydrolase